MHALLLAAVLLPFLTGSSAAQEKPVTVALVGDSTVTDDAGWGRAFAARFNDSVTVLNFSAGGRSSKSWYDEKRLPAVLQARPDFVLIQFGHNDQPGKGPERETDPATTYRDYLRIYVTAFREIGATPILVSSVTRRHFDADGKIRSSLAPWAAATKQVAADMKVPFIDLHTASVDYHNRLGPEKSMAFNPKPGDLTHFNAQGAEVVADLVVRQLRQVCPDLARHLKGP
ncbi:MAG: rhamnogalacturonan acetylesterase [Thermoguttaceae bacterium]